MCGLAGYLSRSVPATVKTAAAMGSAILHRGPDSGGEWVDAEAGYAVAYRRLAIVDLSEAGSQPMISANGRFVIAYNGEVYNHLDMKRDLEADGVRIAWRGHSDTEILLEAFAHWGVEATLKRANGMFAVALWDRQMRRLWLARDRLGEKPMYYGRSGGSLLFGSELKALARHPDWTGNIDRNVVALYLRFAYVPEPFCIIDGMRKLLPGHFIEIDANSQAGLPASRPYWTMDDVVAAPRRSDPEPVLLDELEQKLKASVLSRMHADVPLGAFLSGGIDSSAVVALMQAQSSQPVRTFTIGFDVPGFNEAESAKAIAAHLGTRHTELYLTPQDALNVVPSLPHIWDEPFADSSQMPTLLLAKMTREHVTVALSGDGGDEVFCGYNRYGQGHRYHQQLSVLPRPVRTVVGQVLKRAPVQTIDRLVANMPQRWRYPAVGDKFQKLGRVLETTDMGQFYGTLVSQFDNAGALVRDSTLPKTLVDEPDQWPALDDFRETMMYLDTRSYLPGDILTKVDRATMAVSLEGRAPYLDHDLIAFAWTLPMSMKIKNGQTKWALREVLARYVPRSMFERPKMGFGIPIEHWLAGPLRDWAGDLLAEDRLRAQGLLNPEPILRMWRDQLSGRGRWHHQLWTVLMLQAWLDGGIPAKVPAIAS